MLRCYGFSSLPLTSNHSCWLQAHLPSRKHYWRYVNKPKRQAVIFKQKVKTHNNEHFDDHLILNFGSQLPYCFEKKASVKWISNKIPRIYLNSMAFSQIVVFKSIDVAGGLVQRIFISQRAARTSLISLFLKLKSCFFDDLTKTSLLKIVSDTPFAKNKLRLIVLCEALWQSY